MAEESMIPTVRFLGFSEGWDRKPTSVLLIERDTQAPKSEKFPLMAFVANEGVAPKGDRYNREFLVNDEINKKYKQTEFGDFIYSSNNLETGSIGLNNYGCASISPVYSIFKPTELGASSFIGCLLTRKKFIDQMVRWRQGVVYGQWRIHESNFLKIEIKFPSVPEQRKIGAYFAELDRIIGLHQRKHKKLVTLKKAMLKKMFPQNGASTPEIRFKGFSGPWDEKELGDISHIIGGGTPSTGIPEYWEGDVDWYSPTEIGEKVYAEESVKKITRLGLEKCSAQILPADKTVLFTSRAGIGDMAILKNPGATNQGFQSLVLKDGIDTYFMYTAGFLIKRYALKHASGSTFLEISGKQLERMSMLIPSEQEQQKIGTNFRQLDKLIALHGTQVEKLKQIKTACLEKMFV